MSPRSWFEALRGRAAKKKLIRPQVRSRYVPLLERLEDRTVLDAVNWINAAGGDWDTAANWVDTADNSHHVPGATDDVTINVAGNVTITHNQNVTDAINSLSATDIVQLNAGTLNVAAALSSTSSFQMHGGTLGNAIVQAATTITGTTSGGTLNAVTLDGTLDLTTASSVHVSVTGGLTLGNGAVLEIGSNTGLYGYVSFNGGNQTLGGAGSVLFGSSTVNTLWTGQSSGTNLTIGPNILIHGQNGVVGVNSGGLGNFTDGTFTNQGTIDADVSGGLIQLNGVNWTNANTGTIEAATGAAITLVGSWSNSGVIAGATNATVNLGGTFSTPTLGGFSAAGANVNVVGTLTNTGSTLTLTDASGVWHMMGGTIDGGALATTGSKGLIATTSGGTLANGVTLNGTLDLTTASSVHVSVTGGLTLGNGAVLEIGSNTGLYGYVSFNGGNQTLGGAGSVLFGSSTVNTLWTGQSSGTNLTIGPNILIHGQNGVVGVNSGGLGNFTDGTFTNQGTIDADVSGGLIQLNGVNWTNANTGTIEAATGAAITLVGSWSNSGVIAGATNATVNLGGTFSTPTLGGFSAAGANVNVVGTLTNTGSTLTLTDASGVWHMMGGTIDGGALATTGSKGLIATTSGGTLANGVTLNGTLDLTTTSSVHVSVTGGLTLGNGAVLEIGSNTGLYGYVSFNGGNQTLGGAGSVLFGSSTVNTLWTGQSSGTNLTIGPNILIHGQNGVVGVNSGGLGNFTDGTFTNQGTIDADVSGGLIQLNGVNWTNAGVSPKGIQVVAGATATLTGSWINSGTISAASSSTLNLSGAFATANLGAINSAGATVNLVGTLTNSATNLTLNDTTGSWRFLGGAIDGGTVTTTGSNALIATTSGGTLANGVTLDGTLDLTTANNVHVSVTGGLTLGNGTVLQVGSNTGNSGYVSFNGGNQTLGGNGSVLFASSSNNTLWTGQSSGTNLTIGPNILIHGQNGIVGVNTNGLGGSSDGTLTNQGAIDADVSGGVIQINGVNWTNATTGVIEAATGASATLAGSWNNQGSLSAVANATLNLGSATGAWTNTGTITAAANATVNLGGIVTNAGLGDFSSTGANVNIVGTLTNTGSTLTLTDTSGIWHMMGGTIDGGAVATTGSNALIATISGGTLANDVTLDGTLDLTSANNVHVSVTGGLTLGAGTVLPIGGSTGNLGYLSFNGGNQTLGGSGSVLFGKSSGNTIWTGQSAGTHLTIGPNILIHGQNGIVGPNSNQFGGFVDGTLTNQGAIDADVSGGVIQISGVNWTNATTGVIEAATGASATLAGSWNNQGSLSAVANATLNLGIAAGAWTNTGTITAAANATVNLGGIVTNVGLGNFSSSGANVNIVGTLTNTGSTLTLTDTSGTWHMMGGTIDGGAIATTGSNALIATTSGGTLANGVTLDGTLDLTTTNNVHVSVTGGLTLGAGTVLQIGDSTGNLGYLSFNGGNQTLGGSGSVLFGKSSGNTLWTGQSSGTNLTIGPNILIHGQNGVVGPNSGQLGGFTDGTFANQGTIDADVSGGVIQLNGINWSNANTGVIEAATGASATLAGSWSNNGSISAAANATLNLGSAGGTWTDNSSITAAANATVNLGGTFSISSLGSFSAASANINIVGTLTNTGSTLTLTDTSGTWRLMGGTIDGGIFATTGSNALSATTSGGTLANGVTLDGTLDLTSANNVHVSVTGGLTLGAGAVLPIGSSTGNLGYVSFNGGNQTLGGSGSVLFGKSSGNTLWTGQSAGTNLTIGPNILIHGQNGIIGPNSGQLGGFVDGTFTNQGTIDADVSGGVIQLNGVNWSNAGIVEAQNGGVILAAGTNTNVAAGTLTGGAWKALAGSTLRLIGGNITTNDANIVLDGATSNFFSDTGSTNALANFATNSATGSFTIQNARNFTTAGAFSNAGIVFVGMGSDFRLASGTGYTQTGGDTSVDGTLDSAGGTSNFTLQGGQLDGDGTVVFTNVTNSGGQVNPGVQAPPSPATPGSLTITGTYAQTGAGVLNIRLGGTAAGTFDQLVVSGNVQLGGALAVTLVNSFVPADSNSFPVATFAGNTPPSDFSTLSLPTLTGLVMEENLNSANVTLAISPALILNPSTLPADTINASYNQAITGTGGTGAKTLVVSNIQNAIPGLDIPANGVDTLTITGTPTATGTVTFTVSSTDSLGATIQADYSVTVNPGLSLTPATLPSASAAVVYNQTITVVGGTTPYTNITVTNFSPGATGLTTAAFSTNTAAGTITIDGTPLAPGTASFTVNITDAAGARLSQDYTLTVVPLLVSTPLISPSSTSEGANTSFSINGTFSDPGGINEEPFSAVIHWGDGATDLATVSGNGNPFSYAFSGNHIYAQSGTYDVAVSVTDMDGDTGISAASTISVANVAPTVSIPTVSPTSTNEGASTGFTVNGTFIDPANALDEPYTAVINWGDNTTDTATVSGSDNPFNYAFSGNHTYAQNGNYSVTVSITDKDGGTGASAPVVVSVANVPPTVDMPTVSPTSTNEGASTSFTVNGTFTDPANVLDEPFTAIINWGDNSTDTAMVTGSGNPFNYAFSGNHTYAQSGSYDVTVSVTDKDGGTGTSAPVAVSVANVPPTVDTPTVSPTSTNEGASTTFTVNGTFTDPANALDEPFSAVINWGDNSTDTATATGSGNPFNYAFSGNHTYAQSGSYDVTVSVTDKDGGTGTSAPVTVSVANVPPTVDTPMVSPTATDEGTSTSFTVNGTFTDPANALDEPFSAVINWGDNSTDTATVTGSGNPFNYAFSGNHTYAQSGSYDVTVSVTDKDGGTGTSAPVTVSVANVPPTVGIPTVSPTNTNEGASTSFTVNGTFTDPANALDEPFTAIINWGDNTTDTATVSGSDNPFNYAFSGNHTYAQNGNYNVTVSITDKDGGTGASAPVVVSVANVPPTVDMPTVSPTNTNEGASTSFTVNGTFTDPANALDEPFTAIINWGDNTTDTATVSGSDNPFNYAFSGNHTYAQNGNYNVTVSITDKDGGTGASAPVVVSVANVPPTVDMPTVSPTSTNEGASTSFTVNGTFTDPANALDEPFTAVINWGDNSTDTATVTGSGNPFNYAFSGNHTYAQSGSYDVTVSVTDKDGGTGTSSDVIVNVAAAFTTATHFGIIAPNSATAGTAFGFTVTALDALNHPVTGYAGTVHFTSSDGSATLPIDSTLTNGVGTFFTTLNAVGMQTISATDTIAGTITGASGPINVANGTTVNKNTYVQQLYVDLLHRPADAQGQQFFTQLLNSGIASRPQLVLLIEGSSEYHRNEVENLYEQFLSRSVDANGLSFWMTFLGNGGSQRQLEARILGSAEYFQVRGSSVNQDFIDAIYHDVLGRSPDSAGDMFFGQYLATGSLRVGLADLVLNSTEDEIVRVKGYYQQFLRRALEPAGQAYWINLLVQGEADELVIAGIVGSDEYFEQFPTFPG